jgi:S1-C subfamily serine protease
MSGINNANGHRPSGVMNLLHPALKEAPRPDRAALGFDLDVALAAVVQLSATVPDDAFTAEILGTVREGSGVVIDAHGLVLTIGYLITEASAVELTAEGKSVDAEPIAYDHETGFGMVRAVQPLPVSPLPIGRSKAVAEGEQVIVAGHGGFDQSIDGRLVSRRPFSGSWEYHLDEALFTAPMHPYWGGAALIDGAGTLVGIGSLYIEETVPDGGRFPGNMFVAIDDLAPIRDQMIATGRAARRARPWLGLYTAEAMDRLLVTGLARHGPAARAGIEPGDVVLSVQGHPVEDLADMYRTIWEAGEAGVEIRFTLLRDDDVINKRVRSGDRYAFLNLPRRH